MSHPDDQPPGYPVEPVAPVPAAPPAVDPAPYGQQQVVAPQPTPAGYSQPPAGYYAPAPGYPPPAPAAQPTSSLYTAAAIINWVVLGITVVATLGFGVIAAAWMIPMTIMTQKAAKDGYKHTALAVCTLLFCGLISGILMLVDDSNRQPKPTY